VQGTDAVIDEVTPLLEDGDIVIDTGNAHFPDTIRREAKLAKIAEATMARALSGSVPQREAANAKLPAGTGEWNVANRDQFVEDVRQALYASKVVAYSNSPA
jgi:6-phosphogluconate dehydrogenase